MTIDAFNIPSIAPVIIAVKGNEELQRMLKYCKLPASLEIKRILSIAKNNMEFTPESIDRLKAAHKDTNPLAHRCTDAASMAVFS